MGHGMTDGDEQLYAKDPGDHASADSSSGGSNGGGVDRVLKKGPWTAAEDAMLVEYVKKHGEGNWNAVQKHSGLCRCGKSCRLRWANHLRPNLKKGAFTPEEENTIIELHIRYGNKWARMATQMTGRTDNEIKNYWNTRVKRRQRAGLPLYPPELESRAANEDLQNQNPSDFRGVSAANLGFVPPLDIPAISFDNLNPSQEQLSYASHSGLSMRNIYGHNVGTSQSFSFMNQQPFIHRSKKPRLYGPSSFFAPTYHQGNSFAFDSSNSQFRNGVLEKPPMQFSLNLPCSRDPVKRTAVYSGAGTGTTGSHALLNGNLSSSKPLNEVVKTELPSLQPDDLLNNWGVSPSPAPSLPVMEAGEAFGQSPTMVPVQFDGSPAKSSGLLEALVHESQAISGSKNHSRESSHSSLMPGDVVDQSPYFSDWGDSISPMVNSPPNFTDLNPQSYSPFVTAVKQEPGDHIFMTSFDSKEGTGYDAFVMTDWSPFPGVEKEHSFATLVDEGFFGDESKPFEMEASKISPLRSVRWGTMPPVCQMPDHQ